MLTNDPSNDRAAAERDPGDLTPPPTSEPTSADGAGATTGPARTEGTGEHEAPEMRVTRTRTGSALVATVLGLVLALLMLVFVVQNGDRQQYEFLWTDFSLPAGVAMLFAAIVGGLVVALIGLGRIVQIRLAARRHRKADRRAHA
jgi:uncharacterized integral membrane protein